MGIYSTLTIRDVVARSMYRTFVSTNPVTDQEIERFLDRVMEPKLHNVIFVEDSEAEEDYTNEEREVRDALREYMEERPTEAHQPTALQAYTAMLKSTGIAYRELRDPTLLETADRSVGILVSRFNNPVSEEKVTGSGMVVHVFDAKGALLKVSFT